MLKLCDIPPEISRRRIQYFSMSDTDSMSDVLLTIVNGLSQIRVDIIQGKFALLDPPPDRPLEPSRPKKPEHVSEIPAQLEDTRALWEVFIERYDAEADVPDDLRTKLSVSEH